MLRRCLWRRVCLTWTGPSVHSLGLRLYFTPGKPFYSRKPAVREQAELVQQQSIKCEEPYNSGQVLALRAYCARRGWDTHPRIPVTCLGGGDSLKTLWPQDTRQMHKCNERNVGCELSSSALPCWLRLISEGRLKPKLRTACVLRAWHSL